MLKQLSSIMTIACVCGCATTDKNQNEARYAENKAKAIAICATIDSLKHGQYHVKVSDTPAYGRQEEYAWNYTTNNFLYKGSFQSVGNKHSFINECYPIDKQKVITLPKNFELIR